MLYLVVLHFTCDCLYSSQNIILVFLIYITNGYNCDMLPNDIRVWLIILKSLQLRCIIHLFESGFVNYKKGCTRLAAASDNVYQLLSHGRWFSPGSPASSTTKTGRHDIAEILLKVALSTKDQIKSNHPNDIRVSLII